MVKPSKYSFNYDYYEEDLDKWLEEYERIYGDGEYEKIQEEYGKLEFKK
ncbi:MAG: hypothetical protein SV377_04000 [Halobacteria archaeon]|nr:hypothetical protein [Halobacteria archaeon]